MNVAQDGLVSIPGEGVIVPWSLSLTKVIGLTCTVNDRQTSLSFTLIFKGRLSDDEAK